MPADHDTPRPIRVALSNDYELALLGLAGMLARYPSQVQVVGLTTVPRMPHPADVILYDTFGRLPEDDVKLRRIVEENPDAKVVVYSWDDYPEPVARSLGAAGYLSKALNAGELVARLVALHDDSPPAPSGDESEPVMTWPGQHLGLTQRESEMVSFVTRGLTNDEIARRSSLSVNTVKTYISAAYGKIGAASRSQAVAWGYAHGFASTDDTGL